jgi:CheY-like chemotaxis protein
MARILLVEDEQLLLDLYGELLREAGHEVDEAVNGEEGYEFLKEKEYDLVLLDLIMPKMGGVEMLEKLKEEQPEVKVKRLVFMTNLGKEAVVDDGKKYEIKGTIIKSNVTPEEFLAEVKRYLGGI